MEQFEAYFQRADLDRDGRISGAEAVGFFKGSNLPKEVLAKIWTIADQNGAGFLGRPEFYNALKLVTVAQSKRELTPEIVKAALQGPASTKIPPPQINLANIPGSQPNMVGSAPPPRMVPPVQQGYGFRGQTPPTSTNVNQQFGPIPSTTLSPANAGVNQQYRQPQPSTTFPPVNAGMNQQYGQPQTSTALLPANAGMNQLYGQPQTSTALSPANAGMNQQYRQPQPSTALSPANVGMNQQYRQPQPSTTGMNGQFGQGLHRPSSTNINQQFGKVEPSSMGLNQQFGLVQPSSTGLTQTVNRGPSPSVPPAAPSNPQTINPQSPSIANGFVATPKRPLMDPMFGSDVFSANQSSFQQVPSASQQPANNVPTSSAIVPAASTPQISAKSDPFEAFNTISKPSVRVQAPQAPSLPKSTQQFPNQVVPPVSSPGISSGLGASTSDQSQTTWPKMTRASIQKYAKVFMEVDKDRDGKITGLEARNLFLSWRLPREVLKQVWDLSDQDGDSMLSLREFCIALYLMEQYRGGTQLPSTLPNSVMLDETLLTLAGPPPGYGNVGWTNPTGVRPGVQQITPSGPRPPVQPTADGSFQITQRNSTGPVMDNSHANHLSNGEDIKGQEATETNEKVENNENVLLDSREKLEFYRTKMQDLVLYKSRCDNRLNEITERARADKAEAESLEKKYQERYKQVAEIHSKLTIEEASFREVQERKNELQQAIIKMEQGGSADGILQVRADRIQSDLEGLVKALADRCKKHDVEIKSPAVIELPPGWHPGIPEFVAVWEEDWDKFDDEGFSHDVAVPANFKSTSDQRDNSSPTVSEKRFSAGNSAFDAESMYSADESKSPHGSPGRQTTYEHESPTQEYTDNHFSRSPDGDAESHRNFDEPAWGSFDNNDDIDSVWGFGAKDTENGKSEEKYFFESNDFSASPERTTSSTTADSNSFHKPYTFEDSGSPISRTGNSPSRNSMESTRDLFFDNFSGYDSFSAQPDNSSSPRQGNLSRFDSINSTRGFDHSRDYSFDESDPFGSTGPFKVSSETPKKSSDNWNSF